MTSAFFGTIAELRAHSDRGTLVDVLEDGHIRAFGRPAESLRRSWEASIPQFLESVSESQFSDLPVLVEMRMPVGDERADIVLLDGLPDVRTGLVLELKQWSSVRRTESPEIVEVPGQGRHRHPSVQALDYKGKLRALNSEGSLRTWRAASLLHNMPEEYRSVLEGGEAAGFATAAPIAYRGQRKRITDLCREFLRPDANSLRLAELLRDAQYRQTKSFFDIMTKHARDIKRNAAIAVAEAGASPTEEQHLLIGEIIAAAKRGEHKVFAIHGSPGSGKTLVAVHLLLTSLGDGVVQKAGGAVLAMRNNRLRSCLKRAFKNGLPASERSEVTSAIIASSVPWRGNGLGDPGFKGSFGLVVCDEAQRLSSTNIGTIMKRAPTVVFFYDESQILTPIEEGTTRNFEAIAEKVGKELTIGRLKATLRCRGGEEYHTWVDELLTRGGTGPTNGSSSVAWNKRQEFRVFDRIEDMIAELRRKTTGGRVALVASFTESRGKRGSPKDPQNIRVGRKLPSGFALYKDSTKEIRWLMDEETEYPAFWLDGMSNQLDMCASIYGAQGFESDFVGIVWGRDFVVRGGVWKVGDPTCITDNIDGFAGFVKRDPKNALRLFENRYRIFLTRGMLGTYVFCEDEETRRYLGEVARGLKERTADS